MSGQRGDNSTNLLNTPERTERKSVESADEAASRAVEVKGNSVTQGLRLENVHRLEQLVGA